MRRLFSNSLKIPTINIYFAHSLPCDPSSMTRWRKRIGYKGFEKLLKETIDLAKRENLAKPKEFDKIYVDTTVLTDSAAMPSSQSQSFEFHRFFGFIFPESVFFVVWQIDGYRFFCSLAARLTA